MTNVDEEPSSSKPKTALKQEKPKKRGILYLSTIPPYMNVTRIREVFDEFGTVGRVYLQLTEDPKNEERKSKKRNVAKKFSEGWVEYERKSVAKKVALLLNNKQVSTRKKSKHFDCIWNIKYLSGFKWTHLHERLAYEKAAKRQKLRAEIQLAKKKTNFFSANLGKAKKKKTAINKEYDQIDQHPKKKTKVVKPELEGREEFLKSLF